MLVERAAECPVRSCIGGVCTEWRVLQGWERHRSVARDDFMLTHCTCQISPSLVGLVGLPIQSLTQDQIKKKTKNTCTVVKFLDKTLL